MKKLIYIVLVVILLTLIGMYIKDKQRTIENTVEPITIVEESYSYDIVDPITGEVIGTSEGNIVETTIYDDENGDGMISSDSDQEITEENPEMTSDDDETIIAE